VITGQDAEKPSVQYIIDGKQSMTVFKDVRVLVRDAINAAITYLEGGEPEATTTYNNGVKDVPSKPSEVQVVDKSNVREILIDSGYYSESDFTWPTCLCFACGGSGHALKKDLFVFRFDLYIVFFPIYSNHILEYFAHITVPS